jgi:hypothetical protein
MVTEGTKLLCYTISEYSLYERYSFKGKMIYVASFGIHTFLLPMTKTLQDDMKLVSTTFKLWASRL